MDNQRGIPAIFNYPLPQYDFQLAQEARIQDLLLNDPEMLRETVRNRDRMERDAHQSVLKRIEAEHKQQIRVTNIEIYQTDYGGQPTDCEWSWANPPKDDALFL